jgi:hypothetical protein
LFRREDLNESDASVLFRREALNENDASVSFRREALSVRDALLFQSSVGKPDGRVYGRENIEQSPAHAIF